MSDNDTSSEAAYVLFPDDAPKGEGAPEWFDARIDAATQRLSGQQGASPKADEATGDDSSEAAEQLFKNEQQYNDQPVRDFVSGFAHSAAADGDAERAQELLAAGDALSDDFKAAGTDPGALDQAFQIVKDRQADTVAGPISEEAVQAEYMESMELLQAEGVTEADISAARQFIDDLEVVAPGTKATLQATGSGNDPKLVRLVIQESRRRGYGS